MTPRSGRFTRAARAIGIFACLLPALRAFGGEPVRLAKRGCRIPQSGALEPLTNLVAGHFMSRKRIDYAVLCSDGEQSEVLLIDGADGAVIARLNREPDADHVMRVDGSHQLFVREISVASATGHPFCFDDTEPCACSGTTLDGIVDAYEKWSETHCWQRGWHTVTSGD
jgi:hypothetical protein